jgi:phage terminase Nu1 subunit (DNA packaging protein)
VIDLAEKVTQSAFGNLVGISQPAVSDLLSRGVLPAHKTGGEWLLAYCGHLREIAAGRAAAGDLDLATERARLAREQADKIGMQNAITRRELAPVHVVEEILAKAGARVAGILDAIPGAVRRRMPQLGADEIALIRGEIAKARNVAAAISLADLQKTEQRDDADGADRAESPEADA